ncbi:glycosyltransferase family 2 protein [Macrococcoides canis]|uniref:glycosyltransferase family 2 protein n=1 Tax=Macrococcoides canis TaxID=1855823 RepID=UPI0020B6CA17|nr:glycosyltransferase family 2 protein [Macrococcus canis]UTH00857.1 glycosyltransferase family 2 protein [Macrococcus canis]
MKVSVIIPTFRRSEVMLRRAINSINESYLSNNDFEIIVVDDNAEHLDFRKNNLSLVKSFQETNPNLNITILLNENNLGGSLSRNYGARNAKGIYVTFLDDDDIYLENKLYEQYKFINENYDMIFSNLLISDGKKIIDKRIYDVNLNDNNEIMKYHLMYHITGTPTFMLKRELFIEIGGFPEVKMGQEFHLMYNIIKNNFKIGYLNKDLVKAFIHDGPRISSGKNKIDGENKLYEFKKQHMEMFSSKEWNFIKMRHYAVLAYYSMKSKKYISFLVNSIMSFIASPKQFINELMKRGK